MDSHLTKGKLETVKFCYIWEIPNFGTSGYKVGKSIQSPLFDINQEQWYIELYPKGNSEKSKDVISLYLFSRGQKNIEAKYSISILDIENKKYKTVERLAEFSNSGWGSHCFIKLSEVAKNKNKILPDNKLRILCEITVNIPVNEKSTNEKGSKRSWLDADLEALEITDTKKQCFEVLFDNEKFSDIKIMCNSNKCIYAHKAILVSKSEIFQTLFMSNTSSNDQNFVEIEDIEYETLREMIRHIYTGEVDNICKFAVKLLAPAQKYRLTDLSLLCEKNLCDNVSTSNALDYLHTADLYGLLNLRKKTIHYIVSNMKDVVTMPEFQIFTKSYPSTVVDILKCSAFQGK